LAWQVAAVALVMKQLVVVVVTLAWHLQVVAVLVLVLLAAWPLGGGRPRRLAWRLRSMR